ncbi:MAG: phosphoglycolate phosphatase [Pseudomonadota bacterium]
MIESARPDAVVFDLDGTLVDSAASLHRACGRMLAARGLPQPDVAKVKTFVGEGVPTLVRRCLRWAGAQDDPTAFDDFCAIYNADPVSGTTLLPDARETLQALTTSGHPLGLCTNKPEVPTRTLLDALDLGPFGAIAGGDTLPVHKPDPAPLLHVIRALGATPDTAIYVGDSRTDWRTAAASGVRYVHLTGGYETEHPPDGIWRHIPGLKNLIAAIAR